MNILLLTHYFAPENGAPQRRWAALIERLVAMGHSVDVICPPPHYPTGRVSHRHRRLHGGSGRTEDPSGARVFRTTYLRHDGRILSRTLDHLWVATATVRLAKRLVRSGEVSPAIIVATAPALETLIAGRVLSRALNVPLVAEMRDAWPDLVAHTPGLASPAHPTSFAKRWVHEFVTRLQRNADVVVTTTETFAAVLRQRHINDVTVLRNATEVRRYQQIVRRVDSERETLRVLYMGTIGRSQGLERVIEAVARLRAEGVAIEARLIGQGADVGRLRRINRRLGKPVAILGQIDGEQVVEQYAWADTTVVSLRDWEPFTWTVPSKLYELLAAGKHISAIVAGEAADIVRATAAGDVIPPGDVNALVESWRGIARDRERLKVGEAGRSWVRDHADYDRIAARYRDLLVRATGALRGPA